VSLYKRFDHSKAFLYQSTILLVHPPSALLTRLQYYRASNAQYTTPHPIPVVFAIWPLHDIVITSIIWCMAYKGTVGGRSYIAHKSHDCIAVAWVMRMGGGTHGMIDSCTHTNKWTTILYRPICHTLCNIGNGNILWRPSVIPSIYIYIYVYIYIYMYICVCMCTYICLYICVCVYSLACLRLSACSPLRAD